MIKIYEVMAVENSLPLFFFEHIKRFKISISRYRDNSVEELVEIATSLIKPILHNSTGLNLKLTYCKELDKFSVEKRKPRRPTVENYTSGAKTGLYQGERENPLIKQENTSFRKKTEEICMEKGFYDLLLINKQGNITEGTRTNFLLINGKGDIITSPIGDALNGITRSIIFDICKSRNIKIIEKDITENILKNATSLIITGTSPGILPIISCDSIKFSVENSVIKTLQYEFRKRVEKDRYITEELF